MVLVEALLNLDSLRRNATTKDFPSVSLIRLSATAFWGNDYHGLLLSLTPAGAQCACHHDRCSHRVCGA
jgi:hypothetical protein